MTKSRCWKDSAPAALISKMADVAFRRRLLFYIVGWLLIVTAGIAGVLDMASPPRDLRPRFSLDQVLFHAGFLLIAVAVMVAAWNVLARRAVRALPGVIGHAPLVVLIVLSGQLFRPAFANPTCGTQAGCFAVSVAPLPTDIVYEIWKAPSRWSFVWTRLGGGDKMNYSEDGSYTRDLHLVLSGNERILVLARGGYLVDAIDLSTERVTSEFVVWTEPDRDRLMQRNSDEIERLLEANK